MSVFPVVLSVFIVNCVCGQTELFQNADFESSIYNIHHGWFAMGCSMTPSTDAGSGHHSAKVTNRQHDFNGPRQFVNVVSGGRYNMTVMVKLLNLQPGAMYQTVEFMMACDDASGHKKFIQFGNDPFMFVSNWTAISGIHTVPDGAHSCYAYIQTNHAVNYLMDASSLQLLPDDTNWRTDAQARIEKIRKADITVRLSGTHTGSYDVELEQTSHEFGFGCAVAARQMVNPQYQKYQDAFYDNFEWAVILNALKWGDMERTEGHIDLNTPMNAIHALKNKGIKIRAHNVFWGVDAHVPAWVKTKSKADLLTAMSTRINGVVSATKGWVEHWDVNNENLHGDFYERHTGNPNITMKMFRDVHAVDSNVKLFLNDYSIMESGPMAMEIAHQARRFVDAGVPIYGVGIQGHIHHPTPGDITAMKGRLDAVAQAGLPIWITEMTVEQADENLKATALTDLLTLYFSHPSVEGVLFWGFWDGWMHKQNAALFTGDNVQPNAAGRAYQTLYKTTWRTNESLTLHGDTPVTVRGFKGDYSITVKQHGHVLKKESFTLDGYNGKTLSIQIGSGTPSIIVG